MEQIGIRIGMGFIGIIFYALLTARDKNDEGTLSVKDYFNSNSMRWGISLLILIVLAVFMHIEPSGGAVVESATGFALTSELMSFASLGYFLVSSARKLGAKVTDIK